MSGDYVVQIVRTCMGSSYGRSRFMHPKTDAMRSDVCKITIRDGPVLGSQNCLDSGFSRHGLHSASVDSRFDFDEQKSGKQKLLKKHIFRPQNQDQKPTPKTGSPIQTLITYKRTRKHDPENGAALRPRNWGQKFLKISIFREAKNYHLSRTSANETNTPEAALREASFAHISRPQNWI